MKERSVRFSITVAIVSGVVASIGSLGLAVVWVRHSSWLAGMATLAADDTLNVTDYEAMRRSGRTLKVFIIYLLPVLHGAGIGISQWLAPARYRVGFAFMIALPGSFLLALTALLGFGDASAATVMVLTFFGWYGGLLASRHRAR